MPKVKPYDMEIKDRLSRSVIDRKLALESINKEKLGILIGMGRRTMYLKYNKPETLTVDNIRNLAIKLKLSNREIVELCGIEWREERKQFENVYN